MDAVVVAALIGFGASVVNAVGHIGAALIKARSRAKSDYYEILQPSDLEDENLEYSSENSSLFKKICGVLAEITLYTFVGGFVTGVIFSTAGVSSSQDGRVDVIGLTWVVTSLLAQKVLYRYV